MGKLILFGKNINDWICVVFWVVRMCQPQCVVLPFRNVNGLCRIGLFALGDVQPDTELTYDYNFHCYNLESQVSLLAIVFIISMSSTSAWCRCPSSAESNPHMIRPANCYRFAVFVTVWRLKIRRYGFAANNTAESRGS